MVLSWSPEIFRNALDHIPDAVLISDCAGAVRFANRQAQRLLGYAIDELLGQDLDRLVPERFRQSRTAQTEPFAAAGPGWPEPDRPLAARRKDGSQFPAEISFGSIEDAHGTLVVATIRDMTAYQRLSAESSRARDAAAHAERTAQQARDALAATRRTNAAQWTAACYLLRQQLQALAILNGLLARDGQPSEATLTHALSSQAEAMVTMMNLLNPVDDPVKLESHALAAAPEAPDETVARLIDSIRRNASRPQPMSAGTPVAQLDHTVLIVLGDRVVREAAAGLLRISGYDVLTARNVEEAQASARLHPEIGYVLTEQALGGSQTGMAAIGTLRSTLGASLKTILISDDPVIARGDGLDPGDHTRVARMPLQAEELLRMMEDLHRDEAAGSARSPDSSERQAR